MKHYYNLISQFNDQSWEQLSEDEKDNLINSYILFKNIRLPNTQPYKDALIALFNGDKSVSVDYIRYVVFQAIKEDIEHDLEREWVYANEPEDDDTSWQQQELEQQEYEEYNNQYQQSIM